MKTKEEVLEEYRIQSIREAATRVIARKGVAGASMQDIADEAGVAKGTLYLYFRNQDELLEGAIDHALTELLATLEEALDSEGTFEARLKLLIQRQIEFFASNFHLFQIHLSTKYADGGGANATRCDRVSRHQYQVYMSRLTKFISEAIDRGEVRSVDPLRMALFIQEGMVAVLFQRMREGTPRPVEEEVAWIQTMILNGVTVRRKGSRRKN